MVLIQRDGTARTARPASVRPISRFLREPGFVLALALRWSKARCCCQCWLKIFALRRCPSTGQRLWRILPCARRPGFGLKYIAAVAALATRNRLQRADLKLCDAVGDARLHFKSKAVKRKNLSDSWNHLRFMDNQAGNGVGLIIGQ